MTEKICKFSEKHAEWKGRQCMAFAQVGVDCMGKKEDRKRCPFWKK